MKFHQHISLFTIFSIQKNLLHKNAKKSKIYLFKCVRGTHNTFEFWQFFFYFWILFFDFWWFLIFDNLYKYFIKESYEMSPSYVLIQSLPPPIRIYYITIPEKKSQFNMSFITEIKNIFIQMRSRHA